MAGQGCQGWFIPDKPWPWELTWIHPFPMAGMKFRRVLEVLRKLLVAPHLDSSLSHERDEFKVVF